MELMKNKDVKKWKETLKSYPKIIECVKKPNLVSLDDFYCTQLPALLHTRLPTPYLTRSDLHSLMQWKLTRGKFRSKIPSRPIELLSTDRPRLLDYIAGLDEEAVKLASQKAFSCLPGDLSKAVSELTVLKGVGPATASAVLAAYAPKVAPFMSDEAMEAVLGHSKDYSLKQYLLLAVKLQEKAKELSSEDEQFTASDVERALWTSAVEAKLSGSSTTQVSSKKSAGKKRKKSS